MRNAVKIIEDQIQFDQFMAGQDPTNGLADITDSKYSAHYHEMVTALRILEFTQFFVAFAISSREAYSCLG